MTKRSIGILQSPCQKPKTYKTKPSNFGDMLLTLTDKGKKQKQTFPKGIKAAA